MSGGEFFAAGFHAALGLLGFAVAIALALGAAWLLTIAGVVLRDLFDRRSGR